MDFDKLTAEALLEKLPSATESGRWELKSASFLEPSKREKPLREMLGKQISAFGNSGGGVLVIGVSDGTLNLEPCEQFVNRQPMQRWLSDVVETSVDPPIRTFVPLT